jgi:carbon monoxide dehydrogenase subunit G
MTIATHTRTIEAPAADAWRAIADYAHVDSFHPAVERVSMLSDSQHGVGTKRICHFYDGTSATELVTDWVEGESFRVELSDFSMPFVVQAEAEMRVMAEGPKRSSVTITMDFQVKGGALGRLAGAGMFRPMMQRMFKRVLDGLDLHVRTGASIGKDGKAVIQPKGRTSVAAA